MQDDAIGLKQQPDPNLPNKGTPEDALRIRYKANTNLEQISDWLTKILVGVGLTQLNQLPELFDRVGLYFGPAIGDSPTSSKIAISIVLFFSVSGFLFGYLWTRLLLGPEFADADVRSVAERVAKIEQEHQQQEQIDAKALSLANRLLTEENVANFPFGELEDVIKKASAPVRVQLFYQAREARREWQKTANRRSQIERTIPIFRALAASDKERSFHRNYGQLGYALLDKPQPDYLAAEAAFTTAIEIRGPAGEHGYAGYEFYRALAQIMQDPAYAVGQPTQAARRGQILGDIDVALAGNLELRDEQELVRWLTLNAPEYLTQTSPPASEQPKDQSEA